MPAVNMQAEYVQIVPGVAEKNANHRINMQQQIVNVVEIQRSAVLEENLNNQIKSSWSATSDGSMSSICDQSIQSATA